MPLPLVKPFSLGDMVFMAKRDEILQVITLSLWQRCQIVRYGDNVMYLQVEPSITGPFGGPAITLADTTGVVVAGEHLFPE